VNCWTRSIAVAPSQHSDAASWSGFWTVPISAFGFQKLG